MKITAIIVTKCKKIQNSIFDYLFIIGTFPGKGKGLGNATKTQNKLPRAVPEKAK